jgi:hypothetical protein
MVAVTAANYSNFANWNVTDGAVTLVGPGNSYGLSGSGSYVGFLGTSHALLTTTATNICVPRISLKN